MTASTVGLIVEILLFLLGIYVYLFARGFVRFGDEQTRARAEAFRADNGTWMRFLGLGLAAVMGLNVFYHLKEMLG